MYQITLEIRRLDEGPYLGTSPDLPGLIVQGATPDEVVDLAPDIARDLIAVMVETGEPLPPNLQQLTAPIRVTNRSAAVPNHPGDLPTGTLHAVLKGLGIDRKDFDSP